MRPVAEDGEMPSIFYELGDAADLLGVATSEIEEMIELRELTLVKIGSRRLVHVRDVREIADRVASGGPLRTRQRFEGTMVPEAVRRAANELDIPVDEVVYEVLEHATLRMPGVEGRRAKIAVQLPEGFSTTPTEPEETPAEAVTPTEPTEPEQADRIADDVSRAGEELRDAEEQSSGPSEKTASFYAPEQVAKLVGREPSEVNLWIYRRELPTVNINDYLWVPEEAVQRLLEKTPPVATGSPPRPFCIVVPDVETATGIPVSRLGPGETAAEEVHDALRLRISELEGQVEILRGEILRSVPNLPDRIYGADYPPTENGQKEHEDVVSRV